MTFKYKTEKLYNKSLFRDYKKVFPYRQTSYA